jgi:hypothetical protein
MEEGTNNKRSIVSQMQTSKIENDIEIQPTKDYILDVLLARKESIQKEMR